MSLQIESKVIQASGIHSWLIFAGIFVLGLVAGAGLPDKKPPMPTLPENAQEAPAKAAEDCTASRLQQEGSPDLQKARIHWIRCVRALTAEPPGPEARTLARKARMEFRPPQKSEAAKAVERLAEQLERHRRENAQ